ncbi:unnamed protein product [Caenorhabditis angaria]|uniref:Anti-silencing function protein 1 n=1 Tax=Caenorhabditis angaria TaxID=860376 RepID=A0A9P1I8U7_9PELO|nr:unnamed protein product [Caenorhabditis angaria]
MASRVNICQVNILNNPAEFTSKFNLEITFEVFEYLPKDLEWELVYVGSGTSSEYDQVLDSALVGPVPEGRHKFVFDAPCPNVAKIPTEDIVGVSVLLLRCKYNEQEFINLGWFVSNEYVDEELKENPPAQPLVDKLIRKVEIDDLRVTTHSIKWTEEEAATEFPEANESERVFVEEELMPMNDEEVDDEEEDDDEEEGDANAEVDLAFEEVNERVSNALNSLDGKVVENTEAAGDNDVAMEDDSGEGESIQINNDKNCFIRSIWR